MFPNVDANNITEISISAAFNKAAAKEMAVPTIEEIIDDVSAKYDKRIARAVNDQTEQEAIIRQKEAFIEITKSVLPDGFEIVPVLAHPFGEMKDYSNSRDEYMEEVHEQFISYIANKHEDELKEKGLSKYLIRLMKKGFVLSDALFSSVDHILERALGGKLTSEKAIDKNNPSSTKPTSLINHFNNMIFLPHKIHKLKNDLRELQFKVDPVEKPTYMLMLVPTKKSYIASPQSDLKKYGERLNTDQSVIGNLIVFLNSKSSRPSVFSAEKRAEAINCITDELKDKFKTADQATDGKKSKLKNLSRFYNSQNMQQLRAKLNCNKTAEVEAFNQEMEKTRKLLVKNNFSIAKKSKTPVKEDRGNRNKKQKQSNHNKPR